MKVGMLIWSYWPQPEGGAERQCRLLVEALTERGNTCCVISGCALSSSRQQNVLRLGRLSFIENMLRRCFARITCHSRGVVHTYLRHVFFWLQVPFVWIARLSFLIEMVAFSCYHKTVPFDVFHVHDSGWLAGLGVWLGHRWGIPVLCKEATSPALQPISYGTPLRRFWDRQRRQADVWLAQTDHIQRQMISAGIPANRIYHMPNGVCIPDLSGNEGIHGEVLYVGNLTQGAEWKAFDILFDAWVQIVRERPSARLQFVGAGDPQPWQSVLAKNDILDSVSFVGRVPDPSRCYSQAGIFVLPSRVEGMSNALLEAQSWGIACVVSDIPGNTAVVQHERNGLVVPVNDAGALAEAVIRLLDDTALRHKVGQAARKEMVEHYSIDAIAEKYVDIYRHIAGEPRLRRKRATSL
jgi:glycosyltransferase involved in cell wall biosynthesis